MRTDTHHARPESRRARLRVRLQSPVVALLATLALGFGVASTGVAGAAPSPSPSPLPSGSSSTTPSEPASPRATQKPEDDTSVPQADPKKLTFGIGPANDVPKEQNVDGRPYLQYLATPGSTVRDSIALVNLGDKPLTLRVYAADAQQGVDGTFGLAPGDATPTESGSWFKLDVPASGKVKVPGRKGRTLGRIVVPFEARVPADAQPGDHVAGVLAALETEGKNTDGTKLRFDQRIGVRAYFRVAGPINPELKVENMRLDYGWSPSLKGRDGVTVTYDVRNTGNVRMNATQLINLDRRFHSEQFGRPKPIDDLLPGSSVKVTQSIATTFSALDVDALVSVFPTPVDPELAGPVTFVQGKDSAMAWQWPVALLVAVLLLVALAFGLRWAYRRYEQHRNRPGAPGSRRSEKKRRLPRLPGLRPAAAERVVALVGVLGLAVCGALVAAPAHADVSQPDGGKIFLEGGTVSGDPTRAITDGVWGREGKDGKGATFVSGDFTDSSGAVTDPAQAFWLKRFGVDDFTKLGVAFVRASEDGSAERPRVGEGKNAGEVFEWFSGIGVTTGMAAGGQRYNDAVLVVHTLDEFRDWVRNGKPEQVFDDNLVARDALVPGLPVSAHPQGKSIQNRWKAGERISLVVFGIDGFDSDGVPIVNVDEEGRARTAWLTFETEAGPRASSIRTSGAYRVLSASALPKAPDEVSDDPSAEVNGSGGTASAGAGASPSAGASASAGADPAAQAAADAEAADADAKDETSGFGTLWTGSGLAWPVAALVLLAAALVAGRVYLRRSQESS
ncbi:hypothetical protein [Nocardioides sp.]|uniref:COG1470 family protein n=1 Tax=Nocardioides sp. TaxID=35761 RepID=UPI003513C3D5